MDRVIDPLGSILGGMSCNTSTSLLCVSGTAVGGEGSVADGSSVVDDVGVIDGGAAVVFEGDDDGVTAGGIAGMICWVDGAVCVVPGGEDGGGSGSSVGVIDGHDANGGAAVVFEGADDGDMMVSSLVV